MRLFFAQMNKPDSTYLVMFISIFRVNNFLISSATIPTYFA